MNEKYVRGTAAQSRAAANGNSATETGELGVATSGSICIKLTNAARAINNCEKSRHELEGTHLFGIAETWCDEHANEGELTFPGYTTLRSDRCDGRVGVV